MRGGGSCDVAPSWRVSCSTVAMDIDIEAVRKTTKALYEIVPLDEGWLVRMPLDSETEMRATKGEAVRRARELGRRYGSWTVRVLTKSGEIEQELSSADEAQPL